LAQDSGLGPAQLSASLHGTSTSFMTIIRVASAITLVIVTSAGALVSEAQFSQPLGDLLPQDEGCNIHDETSLLQVARNIVDKRLPNISHRGASGRTLQAASLPADFAADGESGNRIGRALMNKSQTMMDQWQQLLNAGRVHDLLRDLEESQQLIDPIAKANQEAGKKAVLANQTHAQAQIAANNKGTEDAMKAHGMDDTVVKAANDATLKQVKEADAAKNTATDASIAAGNAQWDAAEAANKAAVSGGGGGDTPKE